MTDLFVISSHAAITTKDALSASNKDFFIYIDSFERRADRTSLLLFIVLFFLCCSLCGDHFGSPLQLACSPIACGNTARRRGYCLWQYAAPYYSRPPLPPWGRGPGGRGLFRTCPVRWQTELAFTKLFPTMITIHHLLPIALAICGKFRQLKHITVACDLRNIPIL